MGSGSFPG